MTRNEAYEPGSNPTSGARTPPGSESAERPEPVRALRAEDYPGALALWHSAGLRSLRPEGRDSPEAFEAQLRAGRQTLLGLERDGRLIGVVMVTHDGRKGWINRLAVLPDHRREGVGRCLIRAAERHLENEGLRVIGVLIESDNDPSLALFQAVGYRIGRDVVYLSKRDDDRA